MHVMVHHLISLFLCTPSSPVDSIVVVVLVYISFKEHEFNVIALLRFVRMGVNYRNLSILSHR